MTTIAAAGSHLNRWTSGLVLKEWIHPLHFCPAVLMKLKNKPDPPQTVHQTAFICGICVTQIQQQSISAGSQGHPVVCMWSWKADSSYFDLLWGYDQRSLWPRLVLIANLIRTDWSFKACSKVSWNFVLSSLKVPLWRRNVHKPTASM